MSKTHTLTPHVAPPGGFVTISTGKGCVLLLTAREYTRALRECWERYRLRLPLVEERLATAKQSLGG